MVFKSTSLALFLLIFNSLQTFAQNQAINRSRIAITADSLAKTGQKQAALDFLKTQKQQSENQPPAQRAVAEFALGRFFFLQKNYAAAEKPLETALQLLENLPTETDTRADRAICNNLLGLCAQNTGCFATANIFFKKQATLNLQVFGENSDKGINSQLQFLRIANAEGDFDRAEEFGQKALRSLREMGKTDDVMVGHTLHQLAENASNAGDFAKAIPYFQSALEIYQRKLNEHPITATALSTIGSAYAKIGDGGKALEYQQLALEMYRKVAGDDGQMLPTFYQMLGEAHRVQKNYAAALDWYQRALRFGLRPDQPAQIDTWLALSFAGCHRALGNPQLAIHFADTALHLLHIENGQKTFGDDPNDGLIWLALLFKTDALIADFKKNGNSASLQTAAETMGEAQQLVFNFMKNLDGTANKLAIYQQALRNFENMVAINLNFWQTTGEQKWLEHAFEQSEMSKSLLLFQKLVESRDQKRRDRLPAELREREAELDEKLAAAEKLNFEKEQKNEPHTDEQEQVFQLKNEQAALRQQLRQTCPDCFAATATASEPRPKIGLREVQNLLAERQALLEFFTTDTAVFAFLVSRDSLIFRKIGLDFSLEKTVEQMHSGITRYFISENKTSENYLSAAADYSAAALLLHEKLLAPFASLLPDRLIIVPDGVLAYLPFEALLTARPERLDRFQQHSYFGKKHAVGYCYSAALLREMSTTSPTAADFQTEKLLAFAPFFDGSDTWQDSLVAMRNDPKRAGLLPLPHSGEEVFKIAKIMDGRALVGAEASKAIFLREAPHCRILHLATHGLASNEASDRTSNFSFLSFHSTDEKSGRLYVSEIYNLKLVADLVTLSACETGLGQLRRGEGILSLARAFASAGARSLVQSQWVVSDSQTRHLMVFFYKNLRRGLAKDLALAEAKREYLSKFRGEEAHPYFWAGFLLIGDSASIKF